MKAWVLALAVLNTASAFAADVANGTFHYGAIRFEPMDGIAYQIDGKDSAPVTLVVLADFRIDRQGVIDAIDPESALIGQINANHKGGYVVVGLGTPNRCGVAALIVADRPNQIGLGNSYAAKVSQNGPRVVGECYTTKPEKLGDKDYDFHLGFDQPLMTIPKPAPLPAGGAEPGQAYADLVKAIQAADWKGASAHLSENDLPAQKQDASGMKSFFHNLQLNYPKAATVSGGLIKGERAQLDIKGIDHDGKKIRGVIVLRKSGGSWRVLEQSLFFE